MGDPKILLGMQSTERQRNGVIERKIFLGYLLTTDAAEHSVALLDGFQVYRADGGPTLQCMTLILLCSMFLFMFLAIISAMSTPFL